MIIHCDSVRYIWEVLENQEYGFLFDGLDVIDLGCNVGAFSLWIYPHARHIWAVDQDENSISLLRETIRSNQYDKISTFHTKVAGLDTLASFMSANSIKRADVLKMDIEGDELSVVQDKSFPADRIQTIIGEHHYTDPTRQEFANRLTELGYHYTELPNNHFIARK